MSSYVLELLDESHDRTGFFSGLDSVDRYLREIARGHREKGVSVTRVLVETNASAPKTVLGYFTLSSITVYAKIPLTIWLPGLVMLESLCGTP